MSTVKDNIIKQIQDIEDDVLLHDISVLLNDIKGMKGQIQLNTDQKANIEEAMTDYKKGKYHSTEDLFKDLLDE